MIYFVSKDLFTSVYPEKYRKEDLLELQPDYSTRAPEDGYLLFNGVDGRQNVLWVQKDDFILTPPDNVHDYLVKVWGGLHHNVLYDYAKGIGVSEDG